MGYYVVYTAEIQHRILEDGRENSYVRIGIYYSSESLVTYGAIAYNRYETVKDAENEWNEYCKKMRSEWPLRAGMDVASAQKLKDISKDCVTIDGRHHTMRMDMPGEQKQLF